MNPWIDLRSDTVTRPTREMREAMLNAEVGDDVYMEDPTVNRLQARAAEIFEREAALFVPTGTMGNQIAVKIHSQPGSEVIVEESSHIFNYEMPPCRSPSFDTSAQRAISPSGMIEAGANPVAEPTASSRLSRHK